MCGHARLFPPDGFWVKVDVPYWIRFFFLFFCLLIPWGVFYLGGVWWWWESERAKASPLSPAPRIHVEADVTFITTSGPTIDVKPRNKCILRGYVARETGSHLCFIFPLLFFFFLLHLLLVPSSRANDRLQSFCGEDEDRMHFSNHLSLWFDKERIQEEGEAWPIPPETYQEY